MTCPDSGKYCEKLHDSHIHAEYLLSVLRDIRTSMKLGNTLAAWDTCEKAIREAEEERGN